MSHPPPNAPPTLGTTVPRFQADALNWPLLLGLLSTAIIGLLFWRHPLLLPLRLLAVLFHETGHAVAALLVGGELQSIRLAFNESGLTTTTLPAGLFPRVFVSSAGYIGSACFGALLVWAFGRPRKRLNAGRIFALLGTGLLLLCVGSLHDLRSWAIALPLSLACLAAARFAPERWLRPLGILIACFICLYALFDLRSDVLRLPWEEAAPGTTDADTLAGLTGIPALFWAIAWTGLSLLLLWATLRHLIWRKVQPRLDKSVSDQ